MLFRDLTEQEVQEFKQWAHDNFDPNEEPNELWHPVIRAEWAAIAEEYSND